MADDFKLIVFTAPTLFNGEADIINSLFGSAMQLLHLRKPNVSYKQMQCLIMQIPPEFHPNIVLHSHYKLADKFNLKGIHLTEKTRHLYPQLSKKNARIVSTSCHSIAELVQVKASYEYVFLSPIFNSISKQNYNAAFSKAELYRAVSKGYIDSKVIALGGIDESNIQFVRNIGFGGAAVLGRIWEE
ncbi:MAG: thiamine phosphate synthase [Ignavibacteria bacterium]|jgi:thiamine-phosphate pyrophosphorylase|nr:thiamine phosphate synthase [Ignavibacteria bacterium]